jgi:Tol biopolymer transport system component/predicted Ser/Thr protein kinase
MPLTAGTRIGAYEILRMVGAGGMGEVYLARDTRLNRDVAVKTLPAAPRQEPDPLARFRREAQVLASLNHPNIAAVYGFEESDGLRAIVMEFVQGRTLADIIGVQELPGTPALTLAETLDIARQIAAALEAAHEQGIVHRDLKPANIVVRDDGTVKVLDFGLAKPQEAALVPFVDRSDEPTLTSPAVTHQGVILGTAAYMSPEQARAKPADKRSDIWAFGVVLYEMVTGRRPFKGDSVVDVLAAVVMETPDLSSAPVQVRRLLEKCLEKDPRRRLRDISGAALLLEDTNLSTVDARAAVPATPVVRPATWKMVATAAVVAAIAIAGAGAALLLKRPAAAVPRAVEFVVDAPPGTALANVHSGSAVSPDGESFVFSAGAAGAQPSLWLRRLGASTAQRLAGTEGATAPVWSPDGRSIAFMAERKLKRLDLPGGAPVTLADVPRADPHQPAAWSSKGVILFGCPCGLDSVLSTGGPVTTIRQTDGEIAYAAPQFLPGGDRFLYLVTSDDPKVQGVYASSLSAPSQRTFIVKTESKAIYVAPRAGRPGYLLWLEGQTLHARPFDAERLEWTGEPIALAEGIAILNSRPVRSAFWSSDAGMLLYSTAPPVARKLPLAWIGKDGRALGDAAPEGPYNAISISRDGEHAAVTRLAVPGTADVNGDIWLWNFASGTNTRLTFGAKTDENPVWSPNGRRIAFSSNRDGRFYQLYWKDSSGAGEEERLTFGDQHMDPLDWSPDGRYILYRQMNPKTGWDLMLLPITGERQPMVLLQTPESDSDARFSPDGKWLAYHSLLNGQSFEVYVQAFSGDGTIGLTGRRLQVSDGGGGPLWRFDGREIFYQRLVQKAPQPSMMAVDLTVSPELKAGRPRELFQTEIFDGLHTKDVSRDGTKFLVVLKSREKPPPARLTVLTDWPAGK